MKITLIMVSTLDGVIAKSSDHNAFEWTSKEDKDHFMKTSKELGVLLLGGNTFKASGRKTYPGRVAYVLTNNPDKYDFGENVFPVAGTPQAVAAHLRSEGHQNVALIGGASVNRDFLKAGLIDEMYITVEPLIFGKGLHIFDDDDVEIKLELLEMSKLNENGTILLHYRVKNGSDKK
jgi:dihydrofolate reductase